MEKEVVAVNTEPSPFNLHIIRKGKSETGRFVTQMRR
jgi:hypothetical protein